MRPQAASGPLCKSQPLDRSNEWRGTSRSGRCNVGPGVPGRRNWEDGSSGDRTYPCTTTIPYITMFITIPFISIRTTVKYTTRSCENENVVTVTSCFMAWCSLVTVYGFEPPFSELAPSTKSMAQFVLQLVSHPQRFWCTVFFLICGLKHLRFANLFGKIFRN